MIKLLNDWYHKHFNDPQVAILEHGKKWTTGHRPMLLAMSTLLLRQQVLGLLLNVVGDMSELITSAGTERLDEVLAAAFEQPGVSEYGRPQLFWSEGETMAAFRCGDQVLTLPLLTNMKRLP